MTGDERTDYVHRLLQDAGDNWRSQLSRPPDVDVRWFRDAPRVQSRFFAGLAAAGIVVLAVIAGLLGPRISEPALPPGGSVVANGPTAGPSTPAGSTAPVSPTPINPERPTPSPTSTDDIVRDGDFVTVSGYVIERIGGQPIVCEQLISLAMIGSPPNCMDPSVRVEVDVRNLPGAAEVGGTWASGHLSVEGTWEGDRIRVTDARPSERPASSSLERNVPCDAPAGGWPVVDTDLAYEAAGAAVDGEVLAHPDRYAGLWGAFVGSGDIEGRAAVYVVATVDDVETVTTELRKVFSYSLCVVRVPFSTRDLERIEASLASDGRPWSLETNLTRKGVTLRATVLDEAVAAALGPKIGQYTVEPLVRKLADAPVS